jgi:predicted membrane protein
VAPRYRLAIGNMQVDLSNVTFRPGTTHVTASVGIGNLVVDLPSGTAVSVSAHSGLGDVQVFGQNDGGFGPRRVMQSAGSTTSVTVGTGPRIVLDAQTGVGHVQVIRIGP